MVTCDGIEVLANAMMIIILQYEMYQINTLSTVNLYNAIYQLYLNFLKFKRDKAKVDFTRWQNIFLKYREKSCQVQIPYLVKLSLR